jgi:hypothetical protein
MDTRDENNNDDNEFPPLQATAREVKTGRMNNNHMGGDGDVDGDKEGNNDQVKQQKKGPRDVGVSWATGEFFSFSHFISLLLTENILGNDFTIDNNWQ